MPKPLASIRVVHITSAHDILDTRVFEKECKTLSKAGAEVFIVGPGASHEEKEGVKFITFKRETGRFKRMIVATIKAVWLARKLRADIYHIHDPELLPFARLLLNIFSRGILIFDMHEHLPKSLVSKEWVAKEIRLLVAKTFIYIEKILLFRLPVVFAELEYGEDYLWLKDSVTLCNFPRISHLKDIGLDAFKSSKKISYIGNISRLRQSHIVLDALSILKIKYNLEPEYNCFGELTGSYGEELKKKKMDLKLNKVQFRGFVPATLAYQEIAESVGGVCLMDPQPNNINSYPTKLFEYMALGVPVIASDFGYSHDIVTKAECGILITDNDPDHVASAIKHLISNPDAVKKMGHMGQKYVADHYSWEAEENKLIGFYEMLLVKAGHCLSNES